MLTHWGRDNMAAISQTTFSNALSCINFFYEFRLTFHWSSFQRVIPINNIPALVQIMAWRRLGDKPFSGLPLEFICSICPSRMYSPVRYDEFVCNRFRDSLVLCNNIKQSTDAKLLPDLPDSLIEVEGHIYVRERVIICSVLSHNPNQCYQLGPWK